MAGTCEMCGIGPLQSPCGIICTPDCITCWVTVASETASTQDDAVPVEIVGPKQGSEPKLSGSTQVRFCCTDLTLAQVASFLSQVHPDLGIKQPSLDKKPITKTITGTLDEVVEQLGLGATGY
jgi:hypothetical protein